MKYIEHFQFPDAEQEFDFFMSIQRQCYTAFYPFQILSSRGLSELALEPVTILYGGNGSGKSTALNIIAEKLQAKRDSAFNKSNFYADYVNLCEMRRTPEEPEECRIITSDDVFDYMLNIRNMNEGIDRKREDMFQDYLDAKYSDFRLNSLEDYEQLKKVNDSRRKTQSAYVRENLINNVREYSNGESAYRYFTEKIGEYGLYILDEPENSLSPERQQELVQFLEESVRFFRCQFLIATHSPFFLAMNGAAVYDLDRNPVCRRRWTELGNVRAWYDFFKKHEEEF